MESDERGPQQVLVVGGINADVTVSSERRARPGETVIGDGPTWSPGGKGANIAAAAARAGANVTMCGAVGDDPLGQVQVNALLEAGVGVDAIRVSAGQATGVALIVVTPDGENSITVGAGANLTVGPEDLAAAGEYDVMLVQSEVGAATADAAVAVAASTHSRVVLSLAPVSELEPITWQRADPLVVNRDEAGDVLALFGRTAPNDPEVLTVAVREVSGVASVVISLGAEGCVVGSHEGTVHVPVVPTKVVDTTGAGDALTGALLAHLTDGSDLVAATRKAVHAAAETVARPGAR